MTTRCMTVATAARSASVARAAPAVSSADS